MHGVGKHRSLRILLVNVPELFWSGYKSLLAESPDLTVVDAVAGAQAVEDLARAGAFDMMLVDLDATLEEVDWPTEIGRMVNAQTRPRIVGIHKNLDAKNMKMVLQMGINALHDKRHGDTQLPATIRNAYDGPVALPSPGSDRAPSLTVRERAVLELIARGHTSRQVASHLNVSPRTVENHKQRIFSRLGVQNQAEAVAKATRLGLIEGTEGGR